MKEAFVRGDPNKMCTECVWMRMFRGLTKGASVGDVGCKGPPGPGSREAISGPCSGTLEQPGVGGSQTAGGRQFANTWDVS